MHRTHTMQTRMSVVFSAIQTYTRCEMKREFGKCVLCVSQRLRFFLMGPWALFMGLATWKKCKFNFKTRSHDTIHTFKNYFVTVFSVFSNKHYLNRPEMYTLKRQKKGVWYDTIPIGILMYTTQRECACT